MGLGYDCVWVMTTPEGKTLLFKDLKIAEKSIPDSFSRIETAPRKYQYKMNSAVYKLEIQKVRGTAGLG